MRPITDGRRRPVRLRTGPWAAAALLSSTVVLAACGGDADPADAETGIPLNSAPADPAVSPAESEDPLTGSEP